MTIIFAYWKIVGTLIARNSQTYLRHFQLLALFRKLLPLMIPSQLLLVHLLPFVPSNPAGTSLQDSHCYDLTTEHKMLPRQVSSSKPLRRLLSATYHSEQPCQVRVQLHNIIHTLVVVANTDALIVVDVSGLKDSLKSTDVGPYMRDSHVPDASKHRELYSGRSHNDKLQLRRVDINDLKEQSKRLLSADGCILCAMGWTVKCSGDLCYLCANERDFATTEGGPDQSRVSVPVGDNIEPGAKRPADVSDPETMPDSRLASPEPAVAGASKEALAMTDHDLQEANLRVLLDVGNVEYRHNERELQAKEEAKARNKKIENTIKEQNRASGMKLGKPPSLPGYIDNAPSKKRKSRM
jgi:hypothetical protein